MSTIVDLQKIIDELTVRNAFLEGQLKVARVSQCCSPSYIRCRLHKGRYEPKSFNEREQSPDMKMNPQNRFSQQINQQYKNKTSLTVIKQRVSHQPQVNENDSHLNENDSPVNELEHFTPQVDENDFYLNENDSQADEFEPLTPVSENDSHLNENDSQADEFNTPQVNENNPQANDVKCDDDTVKTDLSQYNSLIMKTAKELKLLLKNVGAKGYSKITSKEELVKLIIQHQTEDNKSPYESYTLKQLKDLCKTNNWKGYSKFTKQKDLVQFVLEHQTNE